MDKTVIQNIKYALNYLLEYELPGCVLKNLTSNDIETLLIWTFQFHEGFSYIVITDINANPFDTEINKSCEGRPYWYLRPTNKFLKKLKRVEFMCRPDY